MPGLTSGLPNYGDAGFSEYLRRAFIKGAGYSDEALERPLIGVVNTYSAYNPCHGNVPQLIDAVRRGVELAGGLALDFPTISLHESFTAPTTMYLRNLMSMDTEEMIRAQPMDAVVLIGGCDKTVPAQLMGAVSTGVPAIQLVTGSMLTGSFRGRTVGACTDCRSLWAQYRAGELDEAGVWEANNELVGSVGTCSVMGTASTMACLTEALGVALPGSASAPATTAARRRIAEATGRTAVALASSGTTLDSILTPAAFHNAVRLLGAIGGSTNAAVHLAALAGRLGFGFDLDALDAILRDTPVLVDLRPAGVHYMSDLHRAGGVPEVMRRIADLLDLSAAVVTGQTLGAELDAIAPVPGDDVIRSRERPVHTGGSLVVLRGNLAPDGAVLKQSAASPELLEHTGRAVVFADSADLASRIDDPDLDVRPDDVLVLRNIGPVGAPGMPEAGYIPIPRKLAAQGVHDMVRISDGRMSGTAFGTIVLHCAPEAARGGTIGLVHDGDTIRLSAAERRLELLVDAGELARRRSEYSFDPDLASRGYRRLYEQHVTQADQGADFDFLRRRPGGIQVPPRL
ncbi:IlvD/Edd family dehydratase [Brooklawnia cerclae]|uniref:Dihydroxy-acid dehydratase n=1 Tax=Brooklawnia cerclae TaxID=349934 RepID=A0ABX0SI94_9ACTN|nr:dihydroxy-acid dehydratase [Brooklawnia cerclae]NIH57691.1 dihydroxy-acid dehydratase [Brooklawnia cerclae]